MDEQKVVTKKKVYQHPFKRMGFTLFILTFVLIVATVSILFALQLRDEIDEQRVPEISVGASVAESYYNGSDTIVAVLRYKDGRIVDDHVFTYISKNPSVLTFTTSTSGIFNVINTDFRGDVEIEVRSSIEGVTPVTIKVTIIAPPEYEIALDYNGATSGQGVSAIPVWAGKVVGVNSMPVPALANYEFDGWYPILTDGSLDTHNRFSPEDNYYWGRNLTLRARYKKVLKLNDDMGEVKNLTNLSGSDAIVYYNEKLPDNLPQLQSKNGWTFEGWFTGTGGVGRQYSTEDDIFAEANPQLFAKWAADISLDSIFSGGVSSTKRVVYNRAPELPSPAYSNLGLFVGWYAKNANNVEVQVLNETAFVLNAATTVYAKVKFPIVFDYQGATASGGSTAYYALYNGTLNDLGWSLPQPLISVENGWTFSGWNTSQGGAGSEFGTATQYTGDGVLRLYAKRTSTFRFYREINASGVANSSLYEDQQVTYNAMLNIPATVTADGWTFGGYYNNVGGAGGQVLAIQNYTGEGTRTLYAKWSTNLYLRVTSELEVIGITHPVIGPDDTTLFETVTATYKAALPTLPVPDYKSSGTLGGWYTGRFGQGIQLKTGDTYIAGANLILHDKVEFTISLDYQDAENLGGGQASYKAVYRRTFNNVGIALPTPQKSSWTFDGWYISLDSGELRINDNDEYTNIGISAIYAKWVSNFRFNREVNPEGEINDASFTIISVTYNKPLDLGALSNPIAAGWTFGGWYTSVAGSGTRIDVPGLLANYNGTGGLTLYSMWSTQLALDTQLFASNGAQIPANITVIYKGLISGLGTLSSPVYPGTATFEGWYLTNNGQGTQITHNTTYAFAKNTTLFAAISLSVNIDYQAATSQTGAASYSVIYNAPIGTLPSPRKSGWTFDGYYTSLFGNGQKVNSSTIFERDIDLDIYVKWSTVFDLRSGMATGEEAALDVVYGRALSLPAWDSRGSWNFAGWFTQTGGYGSEVVNTANYTGNGELELFAKWEIGVITLNYVGGTADPHVASLTDVIYGRSLTTQGKLLPIQNNIVNPGYTPNGWYNSIDGGTLVNNSITAFPLQMAVLYQRYTPDTTAITLINLGADIEAGTSSVNSQVGQPMPTAIKPEKTGWTFAGYYYYPNYPSLDSGVQYYAPGAGQHMVSVRTWNILTPTATLYALWIEDFVVSWINYEGTLLASNTYKNGIIPIYSGVLPPRTNDAQYTHTFTGWLSDDGETFIEPDSPFPAVTRNTIYTAQFNTVVNTYSITWLSWDAATVLRVDENVPYGETRYYGSEPTRPTDQQYSYKFTSWAPAVSPVTGNVIYTAIFSSTLRSYTITWRNWDNTALNPSSNSYQYGGIPSFSGDTPARANSSNGQYSYSFIGWNTVRQDDNSWNENVVIAAGGSFAAYPVVGDRTYYAIFSRTWRTYTVTWDPNGGSGGGPAYNVPWGTVYGTTPGRTVPSVSRDGYTFKDWSPASNTTITGTTTFTAQWEKNPCVATGTLITLADGSQVPVEQLTGNEVLLVWNLFTGTFDYAPILFVDSDPEKTFEVISLYFSDGTVVEVVGEHGFWNINQNQWVFLRSDAAKYIGQWFNKHYIDYNGAISYKPVQLIDVILTYEITQTWSPVTFGHLCYYVNGMLSMPGSTEGFINIFAVNPQTMQIDQELMEADIAKYGLFTYEEFAEILPLPEIIFEAFGGAYLKIAIGKEILTWDMLYELVERYQKFWLE